MSKETEILLNTFWRGESRFNKVMIILVLVVIIVSGAYLLGYDIHDAISVNHQ